MFDYHFDNSKPEFVIASRFLANFKKLPLSSRNQKKRNDHGHTGVALPDVSFCCGGMGCFGSRDRDDPSVTTFLTLGNIFHGQNACLPRNVLLHRNNFGSGRA